MANFEKALLQLSVLTSQQQQSRAASITLPKQSGGNSAVWAANQLSRKGRDQ